jgi:hypothetical protein
MQPLKPLRRAGAWPVMRAGRLARPRVAALVVIAAVSLGAVLAGSALVPAFTRGPAGRSPASGPDGGPGREARPGSVRLVPGSTAGAAGGAGAAPAAAGAEDELAGRLDEILRLRERAYARRDATVLDTIYTADCACLPSGRAAIARLRADHALWRGRSLSVEVERLSRVSESLWIAQAVLRRGAFSIEREDGALLSAEPAVRQRYRFALVRTGTGPWLLGHASLVEELPP